MSRTKDHIMNLDRFAQSAGWEDWEQMVYYESLIEAEYLRIVQELPTPPPSLFSNSIIPADAGPEIMALAKIDSREIYNDLSGVY